MRAGIRQLGEPSWATASRALQVTEKELSSKEERDLETSMKKNAYVTPKLPTTLKMRSRNPPKIDRNPSLGPNPFLCSQVPLDRLIVPQGAKVHATGMQNDVFWLPTLTTSAARITANCKTRDIKNYMEKIEPKNAFGSTTILLPPTLSKGAHIITPFPPTLSNPGPYDSAWTQTKAKSSYKRRVQNECETETQKTKTTTITVDTNAMQQ